MKTVLHITSGDEGHFQHAIRCASLLSQHEDLLHEAVTLLPHRGGIRLVAANSPLSEDIQELIEHGVTIKAGSSCFDAHELPREALPGVEIVPSGVSELVRLQSEGYNYVKIP
ncbi:DsrE family protein [Halorubrum aethiopicum]|uniref:DsrE family protein n=1 Tax=Halorubrum aethiopicum TaxID=1758255 RepID=UPI0009B5AF91